MNDQQTLDRIKKLLRVDTERGATDAEVAAAMEAAQRLALRHGLDLNEIDTSEDLTPLSEPIVGETFRPTRTGGGECAAKLPTTDKFITQILQEFFRVQIIWQTTWGTYEDKGVVKRGSRKNLKIFGRQTNVAIAIYVYGFLHHEFTAKWHEHRKKTKAPMSSNFLGAGSPKLGQYRVLHRAKAC